MSESALVLVLELEWEQEWVQESVQQLFVMQESGFVREAAVRVGARWSRSKCGHWRGRWW